MRHGIFGDGFFIGNGTIIFIGSAILVLIVAAIVIGLLIKKKNDVETGLTDNQKQTLNNFDGLVCAMLSQNGAGLKQTEIGANLKLPSTIVSAKLNKMEKEGAIIRKWENDNYTYLVKNS